MIKHVVPFDDHILKKIEEMPNVNIWSTRLTIDAIATTMEKASLQSLINDRLRSKAK